MTPRKNARKSALPTSTSDMTIRHNGGVWRLSVKDFPEQEVFRVYRIEGDINRLEDLTAGIEALFLAEGVQRRRIELNY